MYFPRNASKARQREAQNARNNRAEIVKALSQDQVTRRELMKWGIFTSSGLLAATNGLSPFARSAYAKGSDIPTGTPPTPLFGAEKFTQAMPRLNVQQPGSLTDLNDAAGAYTWDGLPAESNCQRLSHHTDFNDYEGPGPNPHTNPLTGRGPEEGRAPGEFYAHQRWEGFGPKTGYVMSVGQIADGTKFHPNMPDQNPNAVWTFGTGRLVQGTLPPPLIKARYGEPIIVRVYNNMPVDRAENGDFGRNETQVHNHNAHNGSESDGANNCHIFPGQFYDYHYGTVLARTDFINTQAEDPRASGPDGNGGLNYVPGDWREAQGTLWFHDHRFFFTAENVYKGNLGMLNYYSGPDRGNEVLGGTYKLPDGSFQEINLRLPSGTHLDSGNIDFDINLIISDMATDPDGQLFFDIFDTDGFLGDQMMINFALNPYFEVVPRKYRLRLLSASMSRFIKLAFANESGSVVPVQMIANCGNLLPHPIAQTILDQQGVAERFDVVIDFSRFQVGDKIRLVNLLEFSNGRRWDEELSLSEALNGDSDDPAVGPLMEFRVVQRVESADAPGNFYDADDPNLDPSRVPDTLTEQIPVVEPVRERFIEWTRGGSDARDTADGECFPDCGDRESFPWTVRVNGEDTHSLNANRISMLIPKPNEVEHWTLINGGGGWDHPIHLHSEEGVTIDRGVDSIPATERLARKDVWRLRPGGRVKFQVNFSEFGGAYVNHCHNTVHEDNAMLLRFDILTNGNQSGSSASSVHAGIIPTPNPTPDGVTYTVPEILPEGDPRPKPRVKSRTRSRTRSSR